MIFLAIRHLFAKKKQTLFTVLGIFFGTAAFVIISGMMLGFREYLLNELIFKDAHIYISAREEFLQEHSLDSYFSKNNSEHIFWNPGPSGRINSEKVDNPKKWVQILRQDPRVAHFSLQCTTPASLSYGKGEISVQLIGCNPEEQKFITSVGSQAIAGDFDDLSLGNNGLAIGYQIQKKLGVKLSQNVMVSTPNGSVIPFKVVAIFKKNNPIFDFSCYGLLSNVQKLKATPNQVTMIGVKLHDHTLAASLATSWSSFGKEKIESWDQINASLFEMFAIQDAVRFLSVGAVLVVAAFGIYN
ncbi:MAG: ABC transporter permease, partial [Chlamydiota bacterium]